MNRKAPQPASAGLQLVPPAPPGPQPLETERWVDLEAVALHINFSYSATRKMVLAGLIPCRDFRNGSKSYRRFRLSAVDAALEASSAPAPRNGTR